MTQKKRTIKPVVSEVMQAGDITVVKKTPEDKIIVTADLSEARIKECKKIDGVFYRIGDVKVKNSGQCYFIDKWTDNSEGTYVRATNNQLVWCSTNNCYEKKTDRHIKIIVDYVDGKFIEEYIIKSSIPNNLFRFLTNSGETLFTNNKSIIDKHCFFHPLTNTYSFGSVSLNQILDLLRSNPPKKPKYQTFPTENVYDFSSVDKTLLKNVIAANQEFKKTLPSHRFDRFVKKYTLGIEAETSTGSIPEEDLYNFGLIPLKDGSTTGHEFVTTIMNDNKFVALLDQIFSQLSKYTLSNEFCSLHLHVGNVPRTPEFTVALWELYRKIQDDIDEINPPYKRSPSYLAKKREGKDHCRRMPKIGLKSIDESFKEILLFLNQNQMPSREPGESFFRHQQHGRPKWDFHSRYQALNLLPLWFDKKGTVEFRIPAGTVNKYRAIAWVFIFLAIVEYAQLEHELIMKNKDKIFLKDVIERIYLDGTEEGLELSTFLNNYIAECVTAHRHCIVTEDVFGDYFTNDNRFQVKSKGKNVFSY